MNFVFSKHSPDMFLCSCAVSSAQRGELHKAAVSHANACNANRKHIVIVLSVLSSERRRYPAAPRRPRGAAGSYLFQ